jgi:hypothetical protein
MLLLWNNKVKLTLIKSKKNDRISISSPRILKMEPSSFLILALLIQYNIRLIVHL